MPVADKIRQLIPGYMTMGRTGMEEMAEMEEMGMHMPMPRNSIPMLGVTSPFGRGVMGGMATLVKVREHAPTFEDPGWYDHPRGTVALPVTDDELRRNDIET